MQGLVLLTVLAAIPSLRPATTCEMGMSFMLETKTQFVVFFAALYLTSMGTGGVKSALLPFGAEQYDEDDTDRLERKQSFFSWSFAAINLGIFITSKLIYWLQQNVVWAFGFSIGTVCMLLAAEEFVAGTPWYRGQGTLIVPMATSIAPRVDFVLGCDVIWINMRRSDRRMRRSINGRRRGVPRNYMSVARDTLCLESWRHSRRSLS